MASTDIDPITLAYLAGFVDGEGSIAITKRGGSSKWRTSPYSLSLTVAQINPEPLYLLKQVFGGSLNRYDHRKANHRLYYSWSVSSRQAAKTIKVLYPYLLVKKDEAEVALSFASTMGNNERDITGAFRKIPSEIIELRESMYYHLQDLKKRTFDG
jgi:hypothetical protein